MEIVKATKTYILKAAILLGILFFQIGFSQELDNKSKNREAGGFYNFLIGVDIGKIHDSRHDESEYNTIGIVINPRMGKRLGFVLEYDLYRLIDHESSNLDIYSSTPEEQKVLSAGFQWMFPVWKSFSLLGDIKGIKRNTSHHSFGLIFGFGVEKLIFSDFYITGSYSINPWGYNLVDGANAYTYEGWRIGISYGLVK
jgi:hypothetical protein